MPSVLLRVDCGKTYSTFPRGIERWDRIKEAKWFAFVRPIRHSHGELKAIDAGAGYTIDGSQ